MPKVSASAMVAMCTPASSWLTAFIADPAPAASPSLNTVSAVASSTGSAAAKAGGVPAAMIDSLPAAALAEPPEIGASR